MSGLWQTAWPVAWRNLKHAYTNPAILLPAAIFPLIFLMAFAGGLSSVGDTPDFDFRSGYTSFQFVFVYLQAAAFGGVFTGLAVGADWETGFARRLLLAAPRRSGLILGYVIGGIGRFAFTTVVVVTAGLVGGMEIDGTAPQFLAVILLAVLVNVCATLFGVGYMLRAKTVQAAPAMQTPVFLALMLTPVFVPLELLDGWIHAVASWNPFTAIIESGRGYISGEPDGGALALVVALGLIGVTVVWALRSLRRAEAGL